MSPLQFSCRDISHPRKQFSLSVWYRCTTCINQSTTSDIHLCVCSGRKHYGPVSKLGTSCQVGCFRLSDACLLLQSSLCTWFGCASSKMSSWVGSLPGTITDNIPCNWIVQICRVIMQCYAQCSRTHFILVCCQLVYLSGNLQMPGSVQSLNLTQGNLIT